MRELKVVGLDVDGKRIICEAADSGDKFMLRPDERLRAAVRGDQVGPSQTRDETEVQNVLHPKEIQARIRAGASVAQVAEASGVDVARVERFAYPVLLERSRAAELATAAHPVLPDGPSVLTLLETVTTALIARGLDPDAPSWDAWRNEDGRWTVQLAWKAGMSDNVAHFRYTPGAHGGTATAFDDAASELIDPNFARPLRPVAALREPEVRVEEPTLPIDPPLQASEPQAASEAVAPQQPKARRGKAKPPVPAWEDVLLGVRSGGQR
ncbi:septation protein SepH [Mycolicibacterium celeriflavum]|uniref:DNA-binding protein n=1 Tax=Mycolicibacterium celeriflavum TaxID=1249101 RepID=A0A1X0BPG2_MYCCF|nr:septation protein SepH [Mycolicibacterium celeriflavum]MCV7241127.1 DUF3071 domain-containing protein [Mycolicibacterium celeriflavum]ORA45033.1 hypothetical protein BST21_18425 [Mycolicibacterium celeriflavum]BBY45751.1 DNA-binding protein [Mycolicibacterium celeriflavum]